MTSAVALLHPWWPDHRNAPHSICRIITIMWWRCCPFYLMRLTPCKKWHIPLKNASVDHSLKWASHQLSFSHPIFQSLYWWILFGQFIRGHCLCPSMQNLPPTMMYPLRSHFIGSLSTIIECTTSPHPSSFTYHHRWWSGMVVQTATTVVVKILRIASENIEQFEADRRADQPHPSALVSGGWTRKTNHHHQRSHDTRRHQLGQLIDGRFGRWSAVVFGDVIPIRVGLFLPSLPPHTTGGRTGKTRPGRGCCIMNLCYLYFCSGFLELGRDF